MANNGPITNYKPEPVKSVCNKCGVNFNTADSLEVHVKYHHDNLMKKWAIEAAQTNRQRDETNNNNANKDNNIKREYITSSNVAVTAAADSTDAAMKPNNKSPDSYNSSVTPEMAPTTAGHPPTPQSYHSAPSPYQTTATEPANFSPNFHSFHSIKTETLSPNYANFPTNPTTYSENQYFNMEPPQGHLPYNHDYQMNKTTPHSNYRYHPYSNHSTFERSPQVSSSGGHQSPSSYSGIQNPQPTPSPSPKQCDKCGFVCETAGQLLEHLHIAHPSSFRQQSQQQPPQQSFQYPPDSLDIKPKQEDEPQAEILDLDSQKVHVYQTPEEQEDALKRQAELAGMNGGHIPHSVSAMISWHNPQEPKTMPSLPDHGMFNPNGSESKVYGNNIVDEKSLYHNTHEQKQLFQPHQMHNSSDYMSPDPNSNPGMVPNMGQQPPPVPHPYRPYEHIASSQTNPPVITSSQVPNPLPPANIPQPVAKGANWKSNEARRPKTYNCSACNKWFTSSGHLKRHYNTTLHKNAVKTSGQPDPATLPISVHHHPSRDPNHHSNRNNHHQQQQQQQQQQHHHHQEAGSHSPNPLQLPSNDETNGDDNNGGLTPAYERNQHPGLLQQPPSGPYDRHPPNIGGSHGTMPQTQHHSNNSLTNLSTGSPPNGEAGPSVTNHHLDHSRGLQSISTSTNIPPHQLTPLTPIVSNMPAASNPPLPPFNLLNQQPHMMGMHSPTPTSHHPIFHPMAPPHQITSNYPNGLSPHVTQTIMVTNNQPQALINHTTGELVHEFQHSNTNNDGPLPSFAQFAHVLTGTSPVGNVGGMDSATSPSLPQQMQHQNQYYAFPIALFRHNNNVCNHNNSPSQILPDIDDADNENSDYSNLMDEHPSQSNTPSTALSSHLSSQSQQNFSSNTHISYDSNTLTHNHYNETKVASVLRPVDPNIQIKMENYSPTNQNNNHFPNDSQQLEENESILPMDFVSVSPKAVSPKSIALKEKIQNENELLITSSPTISSTNNSDSKHKCVDCDKTFNKACYLTQHNKTTHSGEKPFKCNRCGKRFADNSSFQSHLKKHAGDKPHKCEQCPKQFNHKTDLRRHMCLHSGHKPFVCEICGKGFIRKDHMVKHCDTHARRPKPNNSSGKQRRVLRDNSVTATVTTAEALHTGSIATSQAINSDHSINY